MTGFNRQLHNWQGSVSVQQELRQGMALNVGYFRTWYGGFLVTDNLAVKPEDFDSYCVTVPVDRRLLNSGEKLCGFYDLKPALFGATDNLRTQASNYGKRTEIYNGFDVSLTSRFARAAHICTAHREFDGLLFPTRRRVHPRLPGGRALRAVTLVAIDVASVAARPRPR